MSMEKIKYFYLMVIALKYWKKEKKILWVLCFYFEFEFSLVCWLGIIISLRV